MNDQKAPAREYTPGEVLVKYRPTVSLRHRILHMDRMGATSVRTLHRTDIELVKLPEGLSVETAVELFGQDPAVEQVTPNIVYRIAREPSDPLFPHQWGLWNISSPEAWDVRTESDGIVVAVVDTGVDYNHPDLADNIWRDAQGRPGYDFVDYDNDPMDYNAHGTHVAGIIGAVGNNGRGVSGVNWKVSIMPLRAFDDTGTSTDDRIIEAINYAREHGARIINASWGARAASQFLKAAIDSFDAAGGLFIAAAGNGSNNNDQSPFYPASFASANIVAVAATDRNDMLAPFSNYGAASVHLAAPGTNINSTIPPIDEVLHNTFNFSFPNDWTTDGANNTWDVRNGRLTDSPFGYLAGTNSWAMGPNFSLAGKSNCRVSFSVDYNIKLNDSFFLEITEDGGVTWDTIRTYRGNSAFFVEESLKAYEKKPSLFLRFRLEAQPASPGLGWVYIDDFDVTCISDYSGGRLPLYRYRDGTSMATAHASGVAALIKAENPALTGPQVRQILMETADAKSLPLITGGRINAHKAVSCASLGIPTNLAVTGTGSNTVGLSWTSTGNETGFVIERATVSGGPFTTVATIDSPDTGYTDGSVSGGTTYYFRVRSKNSIVASLPSNEVSATTLPDGGGGGGGGGCFIATAAFGSPLAPEVAVLRQFRDRHLLSNSLGRRLVFLYYTVSPPVAQYIAGRERMRAVTRAFLYPAVYAVKYPVGAATLMLVVSLAIFVFCRFLSHFYAPISPQSHFSTVSPSLSSGEGKSSSEISG